MVSFFTLSVLEIILGIDNLIFIALVVGKMDKKLRRRARIFGLVLAFVIRVIMLMSVAWIMKLTEPVFSLFDHPFSWKDLLLLVGGMFLIGKSTLEMHHDVTGKQGKQKEIKAKTSLLGAIVQISFIDFVFSFDSILTAIGITQNIPVIVAAVVVSMIVMLFASGYIAEFLDKNPTFKMLALAFIMMIGVLLVAESFHAHIPREYIYFSFGFAMFVEALNTLIRRRIAAQDAEK
jgi:predicted tellurium resistance membrane protein TerC